MVTREDTVGSGGASKGGEGRGGKPWGGGSVEDTVLRYEKLWYLFYRYLRVPPGTTQKSTAQKCNILLSIKIHSFRDPTGIVKYGHVS